MPKSTTVTPLAPMDPDDIISAFAYIRAVQARDVETACAVVEEIGPELRQLLLDVAERIIIPVTAVDDRDRDLSGESFVVEALGRMLLDILRVDDDVCPAACPGIAQAIIRFTEEISPRTTRTSPMYSSAWRPLASNRRCGHTARRPARTRQASPPRSAHRGGDVAHRVRWVRTIASRCTASRASGTPPLHRAGCASHDGGPLSHTPLTTA
ncbi:hypothetical protein OG936_39520 (plasmid) [Streptomyces sp. NBC_00846]|uniref:hypothetical protein n=1 Tax=Streptomyces sp. NBC_00846 TaxID=2975849 RepID=UPI002F90C6EB|nr:hypothetical protein OG936_39520 [Streptomyces sp. NBC_00846]